jgi:hypothetical protein
VLEIILNFIFCSTGTAIGVTAGAIISKGDFLIAALGLILGFVTGLMLLRKFEKGEVMKSMKQLAGIAHRKKYRTINFQ